MSPETSVGTKEEALANARGLLVSNPQQAARQAKEIIEVAPETPEAYLILAHALANAGRADESEAAEREATELFSLDPAILEGAMLLADSRLDAAERVIRPRFKVEPNNPVALTLLAEIGMRMGRLESAKEMLARASALAPRYSAAKRLLDLIRRAESRPFSGESSSVRSAKPVELPTGSDAITDQYHDARQLYEMAVRRHPERADYWLSYGHVLRGSGLQQDAIKAYRESLARSPGLGDAWWALADLNSNSFDDSDAAQMRDQLNDGSLAYSDRTKIHFALGRALEQAGDAQGAYDQLETGNKLKNAEVGWDGSKVTLHVDQSIAMFDRGYFSGSSHAGFDAPDPIFVVGLPRAGSTLVEQVLASHPQIEATMELPDISDLASHLAGAVPGVFVDSRYLDRLAQLSADELRRYGQSYIWSSGLRRITDRPLFIDKMPNNWMHIGLILSILPNAKIIDARRHPLDCGVSNFRQVFGQGQGFSYDFKDFGKYYVNYVRLMHHFDQILPGRIHRVIHEELIDEPETVIRALLDYVGVPFDEACVRFHENKRVVRTASSEQVRRPLNREGVSQWKRYEAHISPLREALGAVVDAYPDVPANLNQ